MNNSLLDPWRDARLLAERLRAGASLVILLGAEAWCQKCRRFRPLFETWAMQADASVVGLWLDLDEHAEFLNGYIPDDLPQVLVYRDRVLTVNCVLEEASSAAIEATIRTVGANSLTDPGVFDRLLQENWAS